VYVIIVWIPGDLLSERCGLDDFSELAKLCKDLRS
jgi:hypothetical protein